MRKKVFFRTGLPLISAFVLAVIFFISYNHYLLDRSLANLRVSLREVKGARTLEDLRRVRNVLDNTFLYEITRDDFDFASALRIEASAQIVQEASQSGQLQDLKSLLEETIQDRADERPAFLARLDNFVLNIFPQEKREEEKALKSEIKRIEGRLFRYQGQELQQQYLRLVRLCVRAMDWDKVLEFTGSVKNIDPESDAAYLAGFYEGVAYKFQGDFEQAAAVFQRLGERLAGNWNLFVSYQQADSLYQAGAKEEALKLFESLSERAPVSEIAKVAEFRKRYIYLYDQDLSDARRAREAQERLKEVRDIKIEEEPKADVIERAEPERIDFFESDFQVEELPESYLEEGFALLRQAYFTDSEAKREELSLRALDKFRASEVRKEHKGYLHIGKALSFEFLNNHQEAKAHLQKALNYSPVNFIVLQYAAYVYYRLGLIDRAIRTYNNVVLANPTSYLARYNLATLYLIKDDLSQAETNLRLAIRNNPRFTPAYNNLAYVLWRRREYGEAEEKLRAAVNLDPNYIDAHYNLGIIYYNLGDYSKAIDHFSKVEEIDESYRRVIMYLNDARRALRSR